MAIKHLTTFGLGFSPPSYLLTEGLGAYDLLAEISGSAIIVEHGDTLSSASGLEIHAEAAITEAGDTLSAKVAVPVIIDLGFTVGPTPSLGESIVRGASLSGSIQPSARMGPGLQRPANMNGTVQRTVRQTQSVRQ